MPTLPGHVGSWIGIGADPKRKVFGGEGRWRMYSATGLRRKAFDRFKLFVYIFSQIPTGTPPLDPAGDFHLTPCAHPDFGAVAAPGS